MRQTRTFLMWSIGNCPLYYCGSIASIATFAIALQYGISAQLLFAAVLIWMLAILSYIDINSHLLLDALTIPLLFAGLTSSSLGFFSDLQSAVVGAVAGYVIFVGLDYGYQLLRGREGLGRGDAKLLAALGAWFGWEALPIIVMSAAIAVIIAALCIPSWRCGKHVPFGPFLALGGVGWLLLFSSI